MKLARLACLVSLVAALWAPQPASAFVENLAVQTLATTGYCWPSGGMNWGNGGAASGDDKWWVVYQDSTGGCGTGTHNQKIIQYDYVTGATTSATVDTTNPSCCDAHDTPSVFRASSGTLEIFYGGVGAGAGPVGNRPSGPWYRQSTNANSISAFDARQSVTGNSGSCSEFVGGFDTNGVLHVVCQHQWNGTWTGFDLDYLRRTSGTWASVNLIRDPSFATGNGAPGCQPGMTVQGTTLHLLWTTSTGATSCNGVYTDLYYATSTNGGDTWCNAAGGACFSRTAGLSGTLSGPDYVWPASYKVYAGAPHTGWTVAQLSSGVPLVAVRQASGGLVFRRWNGSSWTSTTVDATVTGSYGLSMVVTNLDKILIYGPDGSGANMKEWASVDDGATWSVTTIHTKGSETTNQSPMATFHTNLGGSHRVLVTWIQRKSGDATTNIMLRDRPQQSPPSPPDNCVATTISSSQIDLLCDPSATSGIVNYRDEMCTGAACANFAEIRATLPLAYSATGLASNTLHRFRRRAFDGTLFSTYSPIFEATTLSGADSTAPTAPSNLVVTPQNLIDTLLEWTASTDAVGVTGYRVYRGVVANCSDCTLLATVAGSLTEYTDNSLVAGTTYYYRVTAIDAAVNESTASSIVAGRVPDAEGATAGSGRMR